MTERTDPPIPRAMSRKPLPPPPAPDADRLAFMDALLDQRSIDPALNERVLAPAIVAERAAEEERRKADDWPNLARYRAANQAVAAPDLVMIGDSLTEIWALAMPELFGARIANRGISGQTSGQILLRFHADVVALTPRRVHILCGCNDIAGNNGPNQPEDYQRNVRAMAEIAAANGIEVLIASLTPASSIFWSPDAQPREWITILNGWLRRFAAERGHRFIDYHTPLKGPDDGLQPAFSADGVHVTRAAYRTMARLLNATLA